VGRLRHLPFSTTRTNEIAIPADAYRQTPSNPSGWVELDQTALAEIAEISAGRLFDQIDREFHRQTSHVSELICKAQTRNDG
jgi:hypothetical protein